MAWDLLGRSELVRRLVTPLRLAPDIYEFDPVYYLNENPGVAASGVDPLYHYMHYGRDEGRLPNAAARGSATFRLIELCNPCADEGGVSLSDPAFRISVLTPSFNTEPRYLRELFQTLRNQQYGNWEWVVADDGSTYAPTIATLRELAAADNRVRLLLNPTNGGISAATNVALATATGTHAALVDHDDLISRDAFLQIYKDWKSAPTTQLYYTDECKLNSDGRLEQFWAKPDWSPACLENTMCIGHLAVYEMSFLCELCGFRSKFDGTQDFDLALRASLRKPKVRHLPVFAYLWRMIPGSAASNLNAKHYAFDRQRQAVLDYARRKNADADVVPGWEPGYWRIKYPLPSPPPLLSYVIPAGGGSRTVRGKRIDLILNCIRSFEECRFYPNREYVVVHSGNLTEDQLRQLRATPGVFLVKNEAPVFNFSQALNLGVAHSRGDFLCLLNDDVEAITKHGGEELVSYLVVNDNVGAIGPLCLYEDGTTQQNGIVLLRAFGPSHSGVRRSRNFGGHLHNLHCRRETFCVGAAVMFVKKSVYEAVGGFSEELPLNYNDVDFCLKLDRHSYTRVVDPGVEVYHYESTTQRGMSMVEQELLFLKHPDMSDHYFSKWFDPADPNFRLNLHQRKADIPFGGWFDRQVARRAAAYVPTGRPKLSVGVSVRDHRRQYLDQMYKSVVMQSYQNKELVIIDHGSSNPETQAWLRGVARANVAKIIRIDANATLIDLTKRLLHGVAGDFFVALDADDFISVDALQILAYAIENNSAAKVFYSDEYQADMNSVRASPYFKPDFDPVLLTNCCYPAYLMAVETQLLRKICADAEVGVGDSSNILLHTLISGEKPLHVRELLYAWRTNEGAGISAAIRSKLGNAKSAHSTLGRFLRERGLEDMLSVEPNSFDGSAGTSRLMARKPLPSVRILDARTVWGETEIGVAGLVAAAKEPGVDWLAILLSPRDPRALLELSAVGWLDPRIVAVSGLLTEPDGPIVRWSGGLFLPGGRLFEPYAGKAFADGGYHGQLWCQRCVDVPAPVNVLIRATSLVQAAARMPASAGADGLMVMLGLIAHEHGNFVAVTPHLRDVHPPASIAMPPMDRHGVALGTRALERGSRWYDGRLGIDPPYSLWDEVGPIND
jgi:glycosyltransferase involved in cell wall biosynthesis